MLVLLKEYPVSEQWRVYQDMRDAQKASERVAADAWASVKAILEQITSPQRDQAGAGSSAPMSNPVDWELSMRHFELTMSEWEKTRAEADAAYRAALLAWEDERAKVEEYNRKYRQDVEALKKELYAEATRRWQLTRDAVAADNQQMRAAWEADAQTILGERDGRVNATAGRAQVSGGVTLVLAALGLVEWLWPHSPSTGSTELPIAGEGVWLVLAAAIWVLSLMATIGLGRHAYRAEHAPVQLPPEPAYRPEPLPPSPDIAVTVPPEKAMPPRPQSEPLPPCPSLPPLPPGFNAAGLLPAPQPPAINLDGEWRNLMLSRRYPNWNEPLPGREAVAGEYSFARSLSQALDDDYVLLSGLRLDKELVVDALLIGPTGIWVYAINYWHGIISWTEHDRQWAHWERHDGGLRLQSSGLPAQNDVQQACTAVERYLQTRFSWLWRSLQTSQLVRGAVVFTHPRAELRVDSACPTPFLRLSGCDLSFKSRVTFPDEAYPMSGFDPGPRLQVAEALLERDWRINGLPLHHGIDIEATAGELRQATDARIQSWQEETRVWRGRLVEELKRLALSAETAGII